MKFKKVGNKLFLDGEGDLTIRKSDGMCIDIDMDNDDEKIFVTKFYYQVLTTNSIRRKLEVLWACAKYIFK